MRSPAYRPGLGRRVRIGSFGIVALIPLACGRTGPEMASVSGKVTYKGQPITQGTISFQPVDPDGRIATGTIGPDGSYSLQTEEPGDGALLGQYRVGIAARGEEQVLDYIPAKPVKPKSQIPLQYENPETSGLTATVKSGRNNFPFDLK